MRIKLQHPEYHDTDGKSIGQLNRDAFYFEIQADGNFETLAHSEVYESKEAALHAIHLITTPDIVEFVDATTP